MHKLWIIVLAINLFACAEKEPDKDGFEWLEEVGAQRFPEATKVFSVNDFGAIASKDSLSTQAIQAAIDSCEAAGGGTVSFAPGEYLSGSIFIASGVNLEIGEGVTLFGSQDITDYPDIPTRVAGIEMEWPAALVNIIGQEKAALSGKGTIHAQGKVFWDTYWNTRKDYEARGLRWIVDYDVKRPRTVLISESSDITIRDLTMQQAGFWTVHVLYSSHVTADGLVIQNNLGGHGPSTDGIDIDSSTYVLVENCDIDCNDDNFCLKSGRDADGLRVNRPTEFVLIRNCISRAGGGLITFGSETSGGIRHVLAHDLNAKGTGVGLRFKSAMTRGGTVEDIYLRDIQMDTVGVAIEIGLNWNPEYSYSKLPEGFNADSIPAHWRTMLTRVEPASEGIPTFKNIEISGMNVVKSHQAMNIAGAENSPIRNVRIKNSEINSLSAGSIDYAKDIEFDEVEIFAEDNEAPVVTNSSDIKF